MEDLTHREQEQAKEGTRYWRGERRPSGAKLLLLSACFGGHDSFVGEKVNNLCSRHGTEGIEEREPRGTERWRRRQWPAGRGIC